MLVLFWLKEIKRTKGSRFIS